MLSLRERFKVVVYAREAARRPQISTREVQTSEEKEINAREIQFYLLAEGHVLARGSAPNPNAPNFFLFTVYLDLEAGVRTSHLMEDAALMP